MTDNRTTELRISEPLRGFIRHQSNRAYIDGGQARWLTKIADEIDAKHEQAVDDARIVEVETSYIDIEQGEVITRFVPEQAIAATLGSDDEYEAKMDELLCRLTNGKWSKSRAYSLDFMMSCVDEEYEDAYEKEHAELWSEREKELEELVRDMNAALIHDNCYRWCEAKEPCNLITDGKCQYRERIRELGIEVVTDER